MKNSLLSCQLITERMAKYIKISEIGEAKTAFGFLEITSIVKKEMIKEAASAD